MAVEKVKEKLNGCGKDKEEISQLMLKNLNDESNQTTLNLLGSSKRNSPISSSSCGSESIESDLLGLDQSHCLPSGLEKCLDLKTREVHYLNSEAEAEAEVFSRKKESKFSSIEKDGRRLDLKLKLSTSNIIKGSSKNNNHSDNIAEVAESAMRLVGCYTCLMYFMVAGKDFKCPKCKGSFLIDFSSSSCQ